MSFTVVRFVDTNILVYAASRDPDEAEKAQTANALLTAPDVGLSVQVLQELYTQLTRPTRRHRLSHESAREYLETLLAFPVQALTLSIVLAAIVTHQRFQISYWDATILEAARSLGCQVVLSEDLDDATDYDGIRVKNPFAVG
jgi:predicted nucleic acid-binding protein